MLQKKNSYFSNKLAIIGISYVIWDVEPVVTSDKLSDTILYYTILYYLIKGVKKLIKVLHTGNL